ncbi:hypothetical protein [Rickettsia endosymbiont of Urophora cardui]|uniref:hypothetical protein n=1 Tax=Rickettsia endosymbiont of Urophora cardui TaxID=3066265 RepID=UPI00313DB3CD
MTCTNNQVGILMQKIKKYNQIISAAKAGMSVKTARKYLRNKFAELNLPIPEASLRGIYGKFSCGPSCFDSNNRGKPWGI